MRILHLGFFSVLILSQLEFLTAKTRTICKTNRIVCKKERIIKVTEATFGRFGRKRRKKKITCGTKNNFLSEVKELCDENTSCLLDTSVPVFKKPCPGSAVCLRVTWRCKKKQGAIRPVIICQGEERKIQCKESTIIIINSATFGRRTLTTCPRFGIWKQFCGKQNNVLKKVKMQCDGTNFCSLRASTKDYAHPCQGIPVYLNIRYTCISDCIGDTFKCTKRSKKCLPTSKRCDGKRDCQNGSDERKCECKSNQFECAASKKCISKYLRCNQIPDCPDESDEKNCECRADEFRCKTSTLCIPESQKCNGKNDCADGSDEINCGCRSNEFQCETSKRCISETLKCDRQQNCNDGSDEKNCGCASNEFQCKTSRKCIPATLECNRKLDCQDESDEQNCNCEVDEFRCTTSTKCIPLTLKCNDRRDCTDGSDEKNCPEVQCGVSHVVPQLSNCRLRIVGGCKAKPHSWPWAVQLLLRYDKNSNFTHECGGAILNSRFVITATHCFLSENDIKQWQIRAGSHYKGRSESSNQIRLIKKKTPLFNPTTNILDRDITILEINTPFVFNTHVRPVCLPERHPRKGDKCAVVGWGTTKGTGHDDILKQTPMPIEDTQTCNNTSNLKGDITDYMFCGGFKEGKNDACQGDSGGPLMCLDGDKYRLQGIVSWGIDCAKPNLPGVYADVFKVLAWIKTVIGM
ncbi:suppressor of tumorigenicity 14 protein-like isoform X2 [Mytilus californianus]|uniref:suppressor of tumorigenicity 14 protein-like isoform X2 n=1 Tax=Mytilus californianus TaxID=6549 RepID=UPI0022470670|nr:suppressor of tumorigenicity 14 protein-like isoform X2 [Mytilus californianus]